MKAKQSSHNRNESSKAARVHKSIAELLLRMKLWPNGNFEHDSVREQASRLSVREQASRLSKRAAHTPRNVTIHPSE